ncbi:putative membrane protein [Wolbachia endosymbiont of Culex quinquefasciatus JHB]|nr:putative membrane protein [Wolbachia endosymbiont of Culex quinquefasciatus JHB]
MKRAIIEDILDMQEEFESLQNLESTTIEQTNIQGQSI